MAANYICFGEQNETELRLFSCTDGIILIVVLLACSKYGILRVPPEICSATSVSLMVKFEFSIVLVVIEHRPSGWKICTMPQDRT